MSASCSTKNAKANDARCNANSETAAMSFGLRYRGHREPEGHRQRHQGVREFLEHEYLPWGVPRDAAVEDQIVLGTQRVPHECDLHRDHMNVA